jgi:hypothetical protein
LAPIITSDSMYAFPAIQDEDQWLVINSHMKGVPWDLVPSENQSLITPSHFESPHGETGGKMTASVVQRVQDSPCILLFWRDS